MVVAAPDAGLDRRRLDAHADPTTRKVGGVREHLTGESGEASIRVGEAGRGVEPELAPVALHPVARRIGAPLRCAAERDEGHEEQQREPARSRRDTME